MICFVTQIYNIIQTLKTLTAFIREPGLFLTKSSMHLQLSVVTLLRTQKQSKLNETMATAIAITVTIITILNMNSLVCLPV